MAVDVPLHHVVPEISLVTSTPRIDCHGLSDNHRTYSGTLSELEMRRLIGCQPCGIVFEALRFFLEDPWASYPTNEFQVSWGTWSAHTLAVFIHHRSGMNKLVEFVHHLLPPERLGILPTMGAGGNVAAHAEQALSRAVQWIMDCDKTHKNCALTSNHVLPHRVIDVRSETRPFLYESAGESGKYIALSHRWGKLDLLKTTKATLESRKQKIELSELSQTFRDAISVTAALGVNYLWVDSLCIIQDDQSDWQQESSMMASTYENAFATLAANANSSALLSPRKSPCRTICFKLEAKSSVSISLREQLPHGQFSDKPENFYRKRPTDYPLISRAWCFQERALSRRVLHFTDEELVFECNQSCQCECGTVALKGPGFLKKYYHDVLTGEASTDPWEGWTIIVEEYCKRELTNRRDFLPALAGIASKAQCEDLGKYFAGLWEKKLNPGLFWYLTYSSEIYKPRKDLYVAPTFSWASLVGHDRLKKIQWFSHSHLYKNKLFDVVEIRCRVDGRNRYGEVLDGFIKLRGPLMDNSLRAGVLSFDRHGQLVRQVGKVEFKIYLDYYDIESYSSQPLICFACLSSAEPVFDPNSVPCVGLLLKSVSPSVYERIGYFLADEDTRSWDRKYWDRLIGT